MKHRAGRNRDNVRGRLLSFNSYCISNYVIRTEKKIHLPSLLSIDKINPIFNSFASMMKTKPLLH